uniref:ABC transporter G family member 20-like n=1 Tax=Dermatophagoides pteronyssinus TaxID=6956 RepID=A0A6P6YCL7_DERPT|nr:ABC transporter G family member 20-like [Dermatophagoides pteronyssinus]
MNGDKKFTGFIDQQTSLSPTTILGITTAATTNNQFDQSMNIFRSTSISISNNDYDDNNDDYHQRQYQQQQLRLQSPQSLFLGKSWAYEKERNSYNYYRSEYDSNDNNSHDDNGNNGNSEESDEQDEQERLASLEALRYALHHAPFCRNMHTLMTVPNEECFEMIGIPTKCAIRIESFSYENILDNINLEIPKGKIYALLGSANNGKSLLLKCILGRIPIYNNSQAIEVFGQRPSLTPLSAICVGYMPQKIALHPELTIEQTLLYYGRLYQLPPSMIYLRIKMLNDFFFETNYQQKSSDYHHCFSSSSSSSTLTQTLVKDLDQGNQWRLSLMVAIIHSPPLLLLDEPTDNVDPFVRSTVWSYLEKLSEKDGMTIVFTTKHPEELCYAYKAGLMRDGHVYIEDRPEELLRNYHCRTYIQMYNKFCMSNIPRRLRPSIVYYQQTNNDGQGFSGNLTIPPPSQLSYQTTQCQSLGEEDSENSIEFQHHQHHHDSSSSDITEPVTYPMDKHDDDDHHHKDKHHTINSDDYDDGSGYSGDSMDVEDLQRSSLPLPMAQWPIAERRRTAYISHLFNFDFKRLYSLILKNFFIIIGNIRLIILFYFIFPAMQIILICFLSSRPLTSIHNLPVTIVAQPQDLNNPRIERLIRYTIDRTIFHPEIIVGDVNESIKRIRRGETLAVIIPWLIEQTVPNFQNSSQINDKNNGNDNNNNNDDDDFTYCDQLIYNWRMGFNSTMFGLRLHLDGSNFFINYLINFTLADSMQKLLANDERMHELMPFDCPQIYHWMKQNHIPISLEILNFRTKFSTLYENVRLRFIEFILPGTLLAIVFAYALVLTAYLFIKEQIAGLQERCLTAGASGIEILISHMISQSALFFLQELLLIFIMKNIFGIPRRTIRWYGPWSLISMLGFMGIIAGLFVGVICPRPSSAAFFISGIFIPGFVLSGIIWPVESLPRLFYYISLSLPLTQPINSLRYIIFRGLDLRFEKIISGFTISSLYIIILVLSTLIIFKIKTSS